MDLPDEEPFPGENEPVNGDGHHSIIDRMRGSGVGVEDPNINADAGPYDLAPGSDPDPDAFKPEEDEPELSDMEGSDMEGTEIDPVA